MTYKTFFQVIEVLKEEEHMFPTFQKEFETSDVVKQTWFLIVPSAYEVLKARFAMRLLNSIDSPVFMLNVKPRRKTDE